VKDYISPRDLKGILPSQVVLDLYAKRQFYSSQEVIFEPRFIVRNALT